MAKGLGKGFAALLADTQEDYSKFSFDNLAGGCVRGRHDPHGGRRGKPMEDRR